VVVVSPGWHRLGLGIAALAAGLASACATHGALFGDDADGGPPSPVPDGGVSPADAPGQDPPDAGSTANCSLPPSCVPPTAGRTSVCGVVHDLASSEAWAPGVPITVSIYDAVSLATMGNAAIPLAQVSPDGCGRFATPGVGPVIDGPGIVVVDDDGGGDAMVRTTTAVVLIPGQIARQNVWALRRTTAAAWAQALGLGPTALTDQGAFVALFVDSTAVEVPPLAGAPVAGARLREGDMVRVDRDAYFTDPSPLTRQALSAAKLSTGENGTALLVNPAFATTYDGDGAGCSFARIAGVSLPGSIQVQEIFASCP
jgi:hypothetical protein